MDSFFTLRSVIHLNFSGNWYEIEANFFPNDYSVVAKPFILESPYFQKQRESENYFMSDG